MPAGNIEWKAKLTDITAAEHVARLLADRGPVSQRQIDTYYYAPHGRLKLREIETAEGRRSAELIRYQRADDQGTKLSDYDRLEIGDAPICRALLERALGVRVVVDKQRVIWWNGPTRIHLDRVIGLGEYLEFEYVLAQDEAHEPAARRVTELITAFGMTPDCGVAGSYSDLLLAVASNRSAIPL